MEQGRVCAVLNELLAGEGRAVAPRILESTVFISQLAATQLPIAQRIARQTQSNCEELSKLILKLGGVPEPPKPDAATAQLHYQDLHYVLPWLIADHEKLIGNYQIGAEHVACEPRAAQLLMRILGDHRQELDELLRLRSVQSEAAS